MTKLYFYIQFFQVSRIFFVFVFIGSSIVYSKNSVPSFSGGGCCCGVNRELTYNNFDFESPPIAPVGGWIDYAAGQMYDGWTVTSGSISIHDGAHGNMGAGNPNGSSQHLDLHGGTPGGVLYALTGLTSGYTYTIELWYAIHIGANSSSANLKIEGGAWLNVSWSAFNKGDALWLKASYMFMAKGASTTMELVGSGPLQWGGMLIDDIRIFECPGDIEEPIPSSIPMNIQLSCIKDLGPPDPISFTDNCDLNPIVSFTEKTTGPECERQIIRTWIATDKCGNSKEIIQNVSIKDNEAPSFNSIPKDTIVYCSTNVDSIFKIFLSSNGEASASDNCNIDHWEYFYNHRPRSSCDTVVVNFVVVDACMNSNSSPSLFIVKDTVKPKIDSIVLVDLPCGVSSRDSLRKWLSNNAYAKVNDGCGGSFKWKNNFNGDSLTSEINVRFTVEDECGNQSYADASFKQKSSSDTLRTSSTICNLVKEYYDTLYFERPLCDSIVITHFKSARKDISRITNYTCNPANAGVDTNYLSNIESCDSLIITTTLFSAQKISNEKRYSCSSAKTTIDTLYFLSQPCDSLHILTTIPAPHDTIFIQRTTCDINQTLKDTLILNNVFGCDSVIITHITYQAAIISYLDSAQCNITQSYKDTIVYNTQLCDSIVIINFSPKTSDTARLSTTTCNISNSGTFIKKFSNQDKCDSIVIEVIQFVPVDTSYSEAKICNSSVQEYDTSYLKNQYFCDSIHIHRNIVIVPDTSYILNQVCDKSLVGTKFQNLKGVYCDSIIVITSTFKLEDSLILEMKTCHLNEVREEIKRFNRQFNCDSVVLMRYRYFKPFISLGSENVSCFGFSDGKIFLDSFSNLKDPLRYFMNGQEIKDLKPLESLKSGTYQIYVIDQDQCISDSLIVFIHQPDSLYVDIGNDTLLSQSQSLTLTANSNGKQLKYQWIPSHLFNCPNCNQSRVLVDSTITVELWVEDENGCFAKDLINIRLVKNFDVWAPNSFSPNGDLINDQFTLYGNTSSVIKSLQIFDRWGELLFHTTNISLNDESKGWNGTFKSQPLSPAVFVYSAIVINPDGKEIFLHGEFTLVR